MGQSSRPLVDHARRALEQASQRTPCGQDVRDPTGRRGDEITFVVNTTSPSFALKIGPTLSNFFTFELSDASGTIRPPQEPGRPPYTSWPESLNYMKLRLVSKNPYLLNATFELGPSGSSVD